METVPVILTLPQFPRVILLCGSDLSDKKVRITPSM
jgi:hypothetical protein